MASETRPQRFATAAIHAGAAPDPATGARVQPIYFTNGFVFESTEQAADIFAMRRTGFAVIEGSEGTGERHLAFRALVARATTVAAADGIPTLADLVVSRKAAEAPVGVGERLWGLGRRGFSDS